MKTLLIVAHCPSPNTRDLGRALTLAGHPDRNEIDQISIRSISPFSTSASEFTSVDGVLLFTTENFGYMSGAMKDMFDRIYYPCLETTQGLPYCLCVRAGKDGTGAVRAVNTIVTGLRWSMAQPPLVLKGEFQDIFIEQAENYALTFATGLEMGIY